MSGARFVVLEEHRTRRGVPLGAEQASALRRAAGSAVELSPSEWPGCYDLTAGSFVGTIALPEFSILVRPKLPIDRVLFLIAYAMDRGQWRDRAFDFAAADDLLESIVPAFVRHVQRAMRHGLICGYRTVDDSLNTVRGRIRFEDQMRARPGQWLPLEVRYDEFTEDVLENRLLRAATAALRRLPLRSATSRRDLARIEHRLEGVSLLRYEAHAVPEVRYTRLNRHYRPALELARLILGWTSLELFAGRHGASSLLVDMNQVFEDFVLAALRDRLGLGPAEMPAPRQQRPLHLDAAKRLRLQPDLTWWRNGRCVFVGDVKYKSLDTAGVRHPDIYQLLAYTIALDLPTGLLLYAAGEGEHAEYEVPHAEKRLSVVPIDLRGEPDRIWA